ncbi:MAG: transposase [Cyanobacteria bacterium REEB459]|nr:transposase [Cyanobacteria bacterium REEB459]
MSKAYTSNLTRDQFELIEPMLPKAKPGGRPRTVCLWAMLNAIFYLVSQGCSWRDLPGDFPAWQTVYTDYRGWVKDGTWNAFMTDCGAGHGPPRGVPKARQKSFWIVKVCLQRRWCIAQWAMTPRK